MGNFDFLMGVGAAQRANRVSATKRPHRVISVIAGALVAVLFAVGLFVLLAFGH
jgi:hypothetical protein